MKILIQNLHSALNLGDDAIMQTTLSALRTTFTDCEIAIAANDPPSWRKYSDIEVLGSLSTWVADPAQGRWRKRALLMPFEALLLCCAAVSYRLFGVRLLWGAPEQRLLLARYYDADLVLSCGGGNFYAHHALSPALIWALLSLAFAVGLGKRVVMLPQSFGPIEGRLQRWLARWTFSHVNLIMAREARSVAFVKEALGVRTPVVLLPDLAFGLVRPAADVRQAKSSIENDFPHAADRAPMPGGVGAASAAGTNTFMGPKPSPSCQIGVTVIDRGAQSPSFKGQQAYEDALASLLVRLARERNAHIQIFCQCYGPSPDQDDRPVARRLHERIRQLGADTTLRVDFRDAREIVAAYGELDLLIGTRMHTGIFALCNAVPVLLIGYQPKACGVMASFGLDRYCCDISAVDAEQLYLLACELLEGEEAMRVHIAERLAQTQEQAHRWIDHVQGVTCSASE
jgi:colanic acid/amylovoran biosynthesis protein